MSIASIVCSVWLAGTFAQDVGGREGGGRGGEGASGSRPASKAAASAEATVLRFATSSDGLAFVDTGQALVAHGSAPDLVRLPDGAILAIFDFAPEPKRPDRSVLAVCRSVDDGRSWSAPRPVQLDAGADVACSRADLLMMGDGLLRLYFRTLVMRRAGGEDAAPAPVAMIRSAVSNNGHEFRLDDAVRLRIPDSADVHPSAAQLKGRVHLFVSGAKAGKKAKKAAGWGYVSRDGRSFTSAPPAKIDGLGAVANAVRHEKRLRAYGLSGGELNAFKSSDGRRWKREAAAGLASVKDAAVVPLQAGGHLMVYAAPLKKSEPVPVELAMINAGNWRAPFKAQAALSKRRARSGDAANKAAAEGQVASIEGDDGGEGGGPVWAPFTAAPVGDQVAQAETEGEAESDGAAGSSGGTGGESDGTLAATDERGERDVRGEAREDGVRDNARESGARDVDGGIDEAVDEEVADAASSTQTDDLRFPPMPNFAEPFDYFRWYRDEVLGTVEDNAHDAYAAFFPKQGEPVENTWQLKVAEFADSILSNANAPAGPWDPSERPELASASQSFQTLFDQFRAATEHTGYAQPADTATPPEGEPNEQPLLFSILLPQLAPHRAMAKGVIADAWRKEPDGQVSGQRMIDAWRTVLKGASHLHQGTTLIEHLVGTAEQNLVEDHARRALKAGVFKGEELPQALETLAQHDQAQNDPSHSMGMEYGFGMQTVQYLFTPADENGRPRPNLQRLQGMTSSMGVDAEAAQRAQSLTPEDAQKSAEAFDGFYRELAAQMREGYPNVRAADLDATTQKYVDATPLTRMLLPSISRVQTIRTRNEASRRATQLTYAVHLYKEQNGRWPASLDELPAEHGNRMRTDPFTGAAFGYRVNADGPMIYSLSENARDDGGIHAPRWNDGVADPNASDDYVFWPPQDAPK